MRKKAEIALLWSTVFLLLLILCGTASAEDYGLAALHKRSAGNYEFAQLHKRFENFIKCELTRTTAKNFFDGQPFTVTMVDLFDIQTELDLNIMTGAVQCFVGRTHQMLYVAVGTRSILGKEQVVYLTIRKKDFTILATQLMKFPYKERCPWSAYWIDTD